MMQAVSRKNVPMSIGRTTLKTKNSHTVNKSQNINEIIQSSIVSLENECSSLKEKVESKQKELAEVLTNCSKQSTNLFKLHSEGEQRKVKKQIEIQNFNNAHTKVTECRDVCVFLQQYFIKQVENINELLKTKDSLRKFVQEKKECANKHGLSVEQFTSKFVPISQELKTKVNKMDFYKNKRREKCDKMVNEIETRVESQRKNLIQLELKLTTEKGDNRGLGAVNQFLLSQKTEVTETKEKSKMEADRVHHKTKNDIQNAQISVDESNNRVRRMKEEVESTENGIRDITEKTLQLNNDNELLNNNLKELIEEENCLNEKDQGYAEHTTLKETEINKLQQLLDEKLQLRNLNNDVEEEQQGLADLEKSTNNEITMLETKEESLKQCTSDVEQKIQLVVCKEAQLDEEADNMKLQMENIDHEKEIFVNESSENELKVHMASENLKMEYDKFVRHVEEIKRNIISNINKIVMDENLVTDLRYKSENLSIQLTGQNKEVVDTEKEITKYNDDFEMKLFQTNAWKKIAKIELIEAKKNLHIELQRKSEFRQMKEDMAAQDVGFNSILKNLTDNYTKKIQVQDELMHQLKTSCESELHEREEKNVQALCELKEVTARITQLQQDMESSRQQLALRKLAQNQCEKLINHLEEKLKKIGTVAKSTVPQQKEITYGSKIHSNYVDRIKDSPGSDSSGLSYNKKKKLLNQPTDMKTSSVKQKVPQGKHKEIDLENAKDDTWFALFD